MVGAMTAAIELTGVTKEFGERVAVNALDLTVPSGSLYGFIGPNGSGKTTTIRMILRILSPTTGSVRVLGEETSKAADDRTGYLPEERGLYRRMGVRECLILFARLKGVRQPDRPVDAWLERLGLSDRAKERVQSLSKGLAQRLQFAAAVVHEPVLVILDEPFSGLDPVSADTLRDHILELKRRGTTIVLSTHDMAAAERLCDAVMMIHDGHKVLDGPIDEVKALHHVETVRVAFFGDAPGLGGLPGVAEITDYGREARLVLEPGHDPQGLLLELMRRGRVNKFEVSRPSLHEIFVGIAGAPKQGASLRTGNGAHV
jgi:ABC-2 type transport system ATP-binding protein